jgi:hypothetical protein
VNPHYPAVAERAAHRCEYCHAPEVVFNSPFEVEHVIPPSRGGSDESANWALACRACNLFKSDHVEGADPHTQTTVRLFHPRVDVWREHFHIEVATGTISGLTPIARATVERLRINSAAQVAARRQWIRLGLFI